MDGRIILAIHFCIGKTKFDITEGEYGKWKREIKIGYPVL